MSTPLMPELPEAEVHRAVWDDGVGWCQYHDKRDPLPKEWDDEPPDEVCGLYSGDQLRAYGLAVWKAAMAEAAKTCDDAHPSDWAFLASAIRSLPEPAVIQQGEKE